jgi:hypothetical protein
LHFAFANDHVVGDSLLLGKLWWKQASCRQLFPKEWKDGAESSMPGLFATVLLRCSLYLARLMIEEAEKGQESQ